MNGKKQTSVFFMKRLWFVFEGKIPKIRTIEGE